MPNTAESLFEHHHLDLLRVIFGLESRVPLVRALQGFAVPHDVLRHILAAKLLTNNIERAFKKYVCARFQYFSLFNPPRVPLASYSCVFCADVSSDFRRLRKKRRSI